MTSESEATLRLAAGRVLAGDLLPYLRSGLYAMVPVVTPLVPECAIDSRWRIYVSPGLVRKLTVEETAGLWLHQLSHLLHQHADRWSALLEPQDRGHLYTTAADVVVNEILHGASVVLPPARARVRLGVPGAHPGMTTEQLYRLLVEALSAARPRSDVGPPDDCGSGVTGGLRPWDSTEDPDDGSVDRARAELIRRQVAKDITSHQRAMGDVPAGLLRIADEILTPQVDWRRELHSVVSRTRATVAGLRDYTYTRVSRRASAVPGIALPVMRQPRPPRLDMVIDTSGSVSDRMLAQVKAELRVIARTLRGDSVRILACDAASAQPRRLRRVDDIALLGGGGTDMRAGLTASASLRPAADIVIVATDGDTPWHHTPPPQNPRARYVVLLLDGDRCDVPAWMHKVVPGII
ncbi:vWA domain-containing protein [Actinoplanes subglobosus]|uniref:VWA-like domain-containing protein n=1 Tax=Actinoplanes subglobosus TaxID=1547892 RepID=A0ABV8J0Y1_9ACTN